MREDCPDRDACSRLGGLCLCAEEERTLLKTSPETRTEIYAQQRATGLLRAASPVTVREAPLGTALGVFPHVPEIGQEGDQHGTWAESAVMRLAGARHLILVASAGELDAAGTVIAYDRHRDGSLWCWMAGVVPAARRQGVLRALMSRMEEWARGNGYESIRLSTLNRFRGMLSYLAGNGYLFLDVTPAPDVMQNRISVMKELRASEKGKGR